MKKLITILIILLFTSPAWGANIFIDLDGDGVDEDGSCANPYNSIEDIDDEATSAANDYYIKEGTSETTGTPFDFDNDGTSSADKIIIGVYAETAGPVCTPYDRADTYTKPTIFASGNNGVIRVLASNYDIWGLNLHITSGGGGGSADMFVANGDVNNENEANLRVSYMDIRATGVNQLHTCVRITTYALTYNYDNVEVDHVVCDPNDQEDDTDELPNIGFDGIVIARKSDNGYIHHCKVYGGDHSGIGIESNGGIAEYNYVYDLTNTMDAGINTGRSVSNVTIRYNWFEHITTDSWPIRTCYAGGGVSNVNFYNNVCVDIQNGTGTPGYGVIAIYSTEVAATSGINIYNNTIYDFSANMSGLRLLGYGADQLAVSNIDFSNNIIMNGGASFSTVRFVDSAGVVDDSTLTYRNNMSCLNPANCTDYNFASMDGTPYASALAFNALAYATGNVDEDPELNNEASGEFWPEDTNANVVDAGYNLGSNYNVYLTMFSDPPEVYFHTQIEETHNIGAFADTCGSIHGVSAQ